MKKHDLLTTHPGVGKIKIQTVVGEVMLFTIGTETFHIDFNFAVDN